MTGMLCSRYGLDDTVRRRRLEMLGLGHEGHRYGALIREHVIKRRLRQLVTRARFACPAIDPRLVRAQRHALESFGVDFDTQGYFEARLRLGHAYYTANISLSTYSCVQRAIADELAIYLPAEIWRPKAISFVLQIVSLDASLTADVYQKEQAARMQRQLERAKAAEARERRRARTDSLTGLVNRDSIDDHLANAVVAARRARQPLSVLAVDLDHFKDVNDRHGHLAGDEVLRCTAGRMRRALRDGDWIGRLGGDEFVVVIRNMSREAASRVAERLRASVGRDAVHVRDHAVRVTTSVGVASLLPGESPMGLLARADAALYAAKRAGRSCVRAAGEATDQGDDFRLRDALKDGKEASVLRG